MRFIALTAALLAGTALAQDVNFSSGPSGGASAGAGSTGAGTPGAQLRAIGTDAGLDTGGEAGVDPGLATTGDGAGTLGTQPGLLGTELLAEPLSATGETDGRAGDTFRPGAGADFERIEGPITDITELPPGAGDDDPQAAAVGFGDAGAPLVDDDGLGTAGAVVLEAEGPVVVVPRPRPDQVTDPADRLTEGVGGDVQPRTLEPREGLD